jgi:perosamine synthetase
MIPLFKVYIPPTVDFEILKVLHSGYIAEGDSVKLFEQLLQKFLCNDKVITTNSCTSALHLSLKLCGVGVFDEVITTPMTCIATNVSIINLGAIPVWADVSPKHGMLTPETLEATILKYPRSKAVIYVCWGGDLGPIEDIDRICKKYNIKLIIDAAQAFGAISWDDNDTSNILGNGKYGDFICFSFQAIKHITTGDGGAIAFADESMYNRASKLKWFGIHREGFRTPSGEINWETDIGEIGYKFHMNNIAGVIGVEQLRQKHDLSWRLIEYQNNDYTLIDELKSRTPLQRSWGGDSASWVSTFLCPTPLELLQYLKEKNIHSSQMHINNDSYSGFSVAKNGGNLDGVHDFMKYHICIPCGWWLTAEDIKYIVGTIKEFYQ